jgi:4-hydroxy-2-oxoheptanedioate aldolase
MSVFIACILFLIMRSALLAATLLLMFVAGGLTEAQDSTVPRVAVTRMRLNRVIDALQHGRVAVGGQIFNANVGSLKIARVLARSPTLQFAAFDMKTGLFDIARLERSLLGLVDRADILRKGNLQPRVNAFARVPLALHADLTPVVGQMLDIGVTGLVFPEIETRAQAEAAVRAMRYPQRDGYASPQAHPGARQAAWHWGLSEDEYKQRADLWPLNPDGELFAILQIETLEGIRNLDAIAQVPGVGALMLGPVTLAESLGEQDGAMRYKRSNLSSAVEAHVQVVLTHCQQFRVVCGMPIYGESAAATLPERSRRQAQGFRLFYLTANAALREQ